MRAIVEETSYPEIKKAFSRRIDFFVDRLQSAILTGAYVMSGNSVNHDVMRKQQELFWRKNINHAAAHLRGKLA